MKKVLLVLCLLLSVLSIYAQKNKKNNGNNSDNKWKYNIVSLYEAIDQINETKQKTEYESNAEYQIRINKLINTKKYNALSNDTVVMILNPDFNISYDAETKYIKIYPISETVSFEKNDRYILEREKKTDFFNKYNLKYESYSMFFKEEFDNYIGKNVYGAEISIKKTYLFSYMFLVINNFFSREISFLCSPDIAKNHEDFKYKIYFKLDCIDYITTYAATDEPTFDRPYRIYSAKNYLPVNIIRIDVIYKNKIIYKLNNNKE